MERNFSVDDIVGTLWKLDANSTNISSSNLIGEHSLGLESFLAQDSGGHAEEVFKKISRVDSDWAFQEFFKFQVSADSAKAESTDAPEKTMRRNESMWAFQEFLKNYVLNDSCKADGKSVNAHKSEEDADQNCDLDLNANSSNVHGCGLASKLDSGKYGVDDGDEHNSKQSHNDSDDGSHQHGCGHGPLPDPKHSDVNIDVHSHQQSHGLMSDSLQNLVSNPLSNQNLFETPAIGDASTLKRAHNIERYNSNLLGTPSKDAPSISELPEQQVCGALNPLFTGLQNVMPNLGHCNPREYEIMLKRQLDLACAAVASTRTQRRSSSIGAHGIGTVVTKVDPESSEGTSHGDKPVSGPLGIPALPPKPKGEIAVSGSAKMNTSGSSGEQSDDDAEVESGSTDQNTVPGDIKRMRRYTLGELGGISMCSEQSCFNGGVFNFNGVLSECCPTASLQGAQEGESRHILVI
eukprot:c24853_g1_i2 orf=451-1842(+)